VSAPGSTSPRVVQPESIETDEDMIRSESLGQR
jgi:hypothetical protein